MSAVLLSNPASGTLTTFDTNGMFTYVPDQDFNGIDSFTYQAVDGGDSAVASATVTLTINPINDTPVAQADVTR